uniref:Uncharacterized protein n=1 Tax=Rhizophora mucronata TaxID=61149 RepID=A0A2P2P5C1_RHIMU
MKIDKSFKEKQVVLVDSDKTNEFMDKKLVK